MGTCLDRGIKVVSNAGGLDPGGLRRRRARGGEQARAVADGRLRRRRRPVAPRRRAGGAGAAATRPVRRDGRSSTSATCRRFVTANAYLGCWGIVEALRRGADIVITGRVTDAAVVCGPAAWHHGWRARRLGRARGRGRGRPRDRVLGTGHRWQLLVLHRGAGHGAARLPVGRGGRRRQLGDRQARRHRRPGVDRHRHVAAALRDRRPALPRPRRHRSFRHHPARRDRAPTACASAASWGAAAAHAQGGDERARRLPQRRRRGAHRARRRGRKAAVVEAAFWAACPYGPDDFASVRTRIVRTDHADPGRNEAATAVVADHREGSRRAQGRAGLLQRVDRDGARKHPRLVRPVGRPVRRRPPYGVYRPALVPAELVPQYVHVDGTTVQVDSVAPATGDRVDDGRSSAGRRRRARGEGPGPP